MAPLIYPEGTWSNGFGRVVRTLQVVAIAGAIGAVGGGVAVVALVGGGSSHQAKALKVSTADHGAVHPAGAAPPAPQGNAAAAAVNGGNVTPTLKLAPTVASAAASAMNANAQQSPAGAEPASTAAASDSTAAGANQHPVQQAAEPANAAGKPLYNRVEPAENTRAHATR